MASTYLSRTPSGAGNRRTWTFSAWVKRSSSLSSRNIIFGSSPDGNTENWIAFQSDTKFWVKGQGTGTGWEIQTNRLARDVNAWYHIVVAFDSTQSTASDRVKLYVNGTQETSLSTSNYPDLNQEERINNNVEHNIGRGSSSYTNYFDGSMSHINFIDGTAYDASAFGSTDSTTGEWKINTSPSVTYGTNGFFILKDGNSVTDQSGNSNNFTVGGGTLTNTEDSPSNVFTTLNPLSSLAILTTGNTTATTTDSTWRPGSTTIGMLGTTGKYYAEFKVISGNNNYVGVYNLDVNFGTSQSTADANRIAYSTYDGEIMRTLTGESSIAGLATSGSSDVVGIAINKNDGEVKFYKNGTLIQTVSHSNITNYDLMIGCQVGYTSSSCFNFGNGYFGTTAVSSAGTNASGNGIFEYDVPTGYTALSTKGLNL